MLLTVHKFLVVEFIAPVEMKAHWSMPSCVQPARIDNEPVLSASSENGMAANEFFKIFINSYQCYGHKVLV